MDRYRVRKNGYDTTHSFSYGADKAQIRTPSFASLAFKLTYLE